MNLEKMDLEGVSLIQNFRFYENSKLKNVHLGDQILKIENSAFMNCPIENFYFGKNKIEVFSYLNFNEGTISNVYNLNELHEENRSGIGPFYNTTWYKSLADDQWILAGNDKILFGNTITTPSTGFIIPTTVINLAQESLAVPSGKTADTNFTIFTIPDHIKYIQHRVFGDVLAKQKIKTLGISSSVEEINGNICCGTTTTTLVFKHPAGKYIKLPTPGSNSGMAYNKDSRALTVYTDNEYIKNYDWATDNATVTFYPLANAPVGV